MAYVPKPVENPSQMQQRNIVEEDAHMEEGTAEEKKQSTQLSESSNQNTRATKRTDGISKVDNRKTSSKKGDSNTNNKNGHRDSTREQQWRPKQAISATLPVISEAPKEKEQENDQLTPQKKKVQPKNQNDSGSRTKVRESHRNTPPNKERSRVRRDLTKVKSDWKEFKLVSFNVRGVNSESK
jgi:hypothetical protein